MAQRQFRSDDTSQWLDKYGSGADGAYAPDTGTDAPIDSACTGTAGETSLTATNASFAPGQLILIHQTRGTGAGNWELNKISSYSAGTINLAYSLINSYASGAQVIVMPQYSSIDIGSGVTITGKAWTGTVGGIIALFCNGTATITGTIQGSEKGFIGGTSSGNFNNLSNNGEGTTGTSSASTNANGNGSGSGYQGAAAGGGGHAVAGGTGQAVGGGTGGTGGEAKGAVALTTMVFGGAGGGTSADGITPVGGKGGGIVLLIAKTITITGGISLLGGTGTANTSANSRRGATGPGAGGSCLLKGQEITLGSNLINALGRTGLTGTGGSTNNKAGDSSAGRIHADYSKSITGTTSPTIDSRQDPSLNTGTGMFLVF